MTKIEETLGQFRLLSSLDRPSTTNEACDTAVRRSVADFLRQHPHLQAVGLYMGESKVVMLVRDDKGAFRLVTVRARATNGDTGVETAELVPSSLPPRLPMVFPPAPAGVDTSRKLLFAVFCGVPGTGKSTLADAVGQRLGVPVFNADWLLGALTPFGAYHAENRQVIGAELLTTLAFRQLELGQSVILDYPTEAEPLRSRWISLAAKATASLKVVTCICSNRRLHEERLVDRRRGIPGWHDGGNWESVRGRAASFAPWPFPTLTLDSADDAKDNLDRATTYLTGA